MKTSHGYALAFALCSAALVGGCVTVSPEQKATEDLMWAAAQECKAKYSTIASVDGIDNFGRIHFTHQGSGPENAAFLTCYRDTFNERFRNAANIPKERVVREPGRTSKITLKAESAGGVYFVPVKLNNSTDALLVVDTGAAWTVLTPKLVEKLALPITANTRRSVMTVIGGRQITLPRLRLDSAKVGSVAVENLYIGVYDVFPDEPRVHGILGLDFLKHFRVSVDPGSKQLVLEPKE